MEEEAIRCADGIFGVLLVASATVLLSARPAVPDGMRLSMKGGGREGARVDFFVKEVTVSPVRAHVGDVVRIDMRWVYWGDVDNREYETGTAEIRANGRWSRTARSSTATASRWARISPYLRLGHARRPSRGVHDPGRYLPVGRCHPYDNFLVVKEPVVLLAPGAEFREAGKRAAQERQGTLPLNENGAPCGAPEQRRCRNGLVGPDEVHRVDRRGGGCRAGRQLVLDPVSGGENIEKM